MSGAKVVDRDFSTAIGGPHMNSYSKRTENVPEPAQEAGEHFVVLRGPRLTLVLVALTSEPHLSPRDEAPLHPNGGSMASFHFIEPCVLGAHPSNAKVCPRIT